MYKAISALARPFAEIAQDLAAAGYSASEAAAVQQEIEFYVEIRSAVKNASGEELDLKPCEAAMRHLLNTYVKADQATALGGLGRMALVELIVHTGVHDAIATP